MGRGPHKWRKVRIIASKDGRDTYGITVPKQIAMQFWDINLEIGVSGTRIILASGCKK